MQHGNPARRCILRDILFDMERQARRFRGAAVFAAVQHNHELGPEGSVEEGSLAEGRGTEGRGMCCGCGYMCIDALIVPTPMPVYGLELPPASDKLAPTGCRKGRERVRGYSGSTSMATLGVCAWRPPGSSYAQ